MKLFRDWHDVINNLLKLAQEMKDNISFYRHEVGSHNHWKFKTLRRHFGWAGEGKFWALNNLIAEANGCRLDLTDADRKQSIAVDLDFDPEEFDQFVACLANVCKLVSMEDGCLLTRVTQETYNEIAGKREYQRKWKKGFSNSKDINSNSKMAESNIETEQSKVKQSTVKESKEKESREAVLAPPVTESNFVVYDAEAEVLANQKMFEQICMKTGKSAEEGKRVLHKYHLFLVEKNEYPRAKKSIYAGFEKWLLNEKHGTNNTANFGGKPVPAAKPAGGFGKL